MSALNLLEILFILDKSARNMLVDDEKHPNSFVELRKEQLQKDSFRKSRFMFSEKMKSELKPYSNKNEKKSFRYFFLFENMIRLFDHQEEFIVEKAISVFECLFNCEQAKKLNK